MNKDERNSLHEKRAHVERVDYDGSQLKRYVVSFSLTLFEVAALERALRLNNSPTSAAIGEWLHAAIKECADSIPDR